MEETEPKVYHSRDENDRNDEIDKKKAKLLEEGGAESRLAPEEGMIFREFVIYKNPYPTKPRVSSEDSLKGFFKHLLRKKPKPTTLPDGHPPALSPPVSAKNFIYGQAEPFDLSDDDESCIANLFASEAVKEYKTVNSRFFSPSVSCLLEQSFFSLAHTRANTHAHAHAHTLTHIFVRYVIACVLPILDDIWLRPKQDKLELVTVTKGTGTGVAEYLYNLTFDAKVLGDGGGEMTKTYQAKVWLKIDGILQVISFKLTDDGQGILAKNHMQQLRPHQQQMLMMPPL